MFVFIFCFVLVFLFCFCFVFYKSFTHHKRDAHFAYDVEKVNLQIRVCAYRFTHQHDLKQDFKYQLLTA